MRSTSSPAWFKWFQNNHWAMAAAGVLIGGGAGQLIARTGLVGLSIFLTLFAGVAIYMLWTMPRPRPCLFCGSKDAAWMPSPTWMKSAPWWAPMSRSASLGVCEEHMDAYLRLVAKVYQDH